MFDAKLKKALVVGLTAALSVSCVIGVEDNASLAAKKVSLSKKKITMKVGESKTIKVKNAGKKAKISWKSTKTSVAKVKKAGKAGCKVTAKKKGSAKIKCLIKKSGKKKTLICNVKVNAASSSKPVVTDGPSATSTPSNVPSNTPSTTDATATPEAKPTEDPGKADPTAKPLGDVGAGEVAFSYDSGNYNSPFLLSMKAADGYTIYYSTDGSVPSPERESEKYIFKYEQPIQVVDRTGFPNVLATKINTVAITQEMHLYEPEDEDVDKATVIRAAAYDQYGNCGEIYTKTFFVGQNLTTKYKNFPVISLTTDPKNLLDDEIGIFVVGNNDNYTQHGKAWERPVNIDYFGADGKVAFSVGAGVRTHGNYTRGYTQKSMNIYLRDEYGQKSLEYPLIPGLTSIDGSTPMEKFDKFVLHNGGNEVDLTKMTDSFFGYLMQDRNIGTMGSSPVIVYLNGEFWGAYNIRDKISDKWLKEKYGVDKSNVILIKDGELEEGQGEDLAKYEELLSLAELDMTQPENYQKFLDLVDLDSYVDYYAIETLLNNKDWGEGKNDQLWRTRDVEDGNKYADTKWRFILHDTDQSFGLWGARLDGGNKYIALLAEEQPLFGAVIKNEDFKQAFASAILELLEKNFKYSNVEKYDAMVEIYTPLVEWTNQKYCDNYSQHASLGCFENRVNDFKGFWKALDSRAKKMLDKKLAMKTSYNVTLSATESTANSIAINGVNRKLEKTSYFVNTPLKIQAPEVEGYTFSKWEVTGGTVESETSASTTFTLTGEATIKAVYTK